MKIKVAVSILLGASLLLTAGVTSTLAAGLADTPWPMYMHDVRHSGQSPYIGAQTNNVKWSFYAPGTHGFCGSPSIGIDGSIYAGNHTYGGGKVFALNPDGTLKWDFSTGATVNDAPTVGLDGTIYIGSSSHKLYAIRPDGTLKWSYLADNCIGMSSPAIDSDGTLYFGSYDFNFYALNPDGTLKWKYLTGHAVQTSPAIGPNGTIYVLSGDKYLYAFNPDGTLQWKFQVNSASGSAHSSPSVTPDGTIYVGSGMDDKLFAINPDGSLKWSYSTGGGVTSAPSYAPDGTIYFGTGDTDKKLCALNPDGSLKWTFQAGEYIESSPTIGADGTIYFGCNDHNVYALKPDGTIKWQYLTGGGIGFPSPAIDSDGTVYIASTDGNVYAFWSLISLEATIDIDPDALNLGSKGNWITCYIELPEGYDVADIDVDTVLLNDTVLAATEPTNVGDYDSDDIPDLMVKFGRADVQEILEVGDEVEITVEGELTVGTPFRGSDTIRVIDKGKNKTQGQISQLQFTLSQNYPNPFNPTTTIEYSLAEGSNVLLKIYNLSGKLVRTLIDEYQTAGSHNIIWHGDNDIGEEIASGVYFCQIKAGDFVSTKKMVVLK